MKSLVEIAQTLRSRTKNIRVTQAELAPAAGVSRRTLGHVLDGEHDFKVSTLLSVADRLGLELALVPKGAARAVSGFEDFETREPAVKTRIQKLRDRLNDELKHK